MPYWIDRNGEKLGPMRAIDVLRRAQPTTRVFDGEDWFVLDLGPDVGDAARPDSKSRDAELVAVQKAAS